MSRVQFIQHKGRKILHLDFANGKPEELLSFIDQAKAAIKTQPLKSVCTLTDVTDAGFNTKLSESLKEFVAHNKPYVTAAAVVGVTGLKQIIFNAVMKFSGRKLHAFDSLDEAKDWLSTHP